MLSVGKTTGSKPLEDKKEDKKQTEVKEKYEKVKTQASSIADSFGRRKVKNDNDAAKSMETDENVDKDDRGKIKELKENKTEEKENNRKDVKDKSTEKIQKAQKRYHLLDVFHFVFVSKNKK